MRPKKTFQFEDLVIQKIDNRGKTPPVVKKGYPLLEVNSISKNNVYPDIEKARKFVDQHTWDNWFRQHLKKDDILFTTVGTIAESAIVPNNPGFGIAQNILGFRFDKTLIDPYYALYLMRSKWFLNQISGRTVETVQKSIKWADMRNIKIDLPTLEKQNKIAEIIKPIDEKIELNLMLNKTLEQAGQVIFHHYFVDNPESKTWPIVELGNYVQLVNGASYKSSELKPSNNALVTLKSFSRGGGFRRDGFKEFIGTIKDTQIITDGDIVVAHTDVTQKAEIAGVPALVTGTSHYEKVGISMDVVKLNSTDDNISSAFLYFLLKSKSFQDHKMGYVSGTTVLHLNKKCIPNYKLKVPANSSALKAISDLFVPIVKTIAQNEDQTDSLTALRESLLPRLISGKMKL